MNWRALGWSIAICVFVAIIEGALASDGIRTWYPTLDKPWWHVPIPVFIAVGGLVYLIDGFVAYRLLAVVKETGNRTIGLTALLVVMIFNALWNFAFFESQSVLVGLLGLLAFLGPLIILQVALCVYDWKAAAAHGVYCVWVVAYDLPLFYSIWKLNS